jgi:ABC-type glycerol-3-phosphate transport system substrate-binding protein
MAEIEFSIYGNQPSPLETPAFLQEFRSRYNVDVRVNRMAWDDAWPKLLNFALHGGGPHISQVGAIWTSTLVSMGALRPFNAREIESLGGTEAFFAPSWQNAMLSDHLEAWGIPFTAYTYVVLYRRDLLQRVGIAEPTAFQSAEAMAETLRRLQAAGIASPIVMPSGNPYRARVHIAASWIWGAGGDLGDDGRHVLFDQPLARAGIDAFFGLYRYLAPSDYNLTYDECLRRFAQGQAAITIAGSSLATVLKDSDARVLGNLGIAVMPGVPWVGGSNVVIWREAQAYPARERAALQLASWLVSPSTQVEYAAASDSIPARAEALPHVQYAQVSLNQVFDTTLRTGRSYRPSPVLVRMVDDLSYAFDAVTADVLADATLDINQAVSRHLDPLARKFNLMLAG